MAKQIEITRSQKEIDEQLNKAYDTQHESKYPGMTYEQGIITMFDWITGQTDDLPMEED